MLLLIQYTARTCPECKFLIKEHPEYSLDQSQKEIFGNLSNVEFVTNVLVADVFRRTLISVSMFSSTLMESIVNLSIPFVFDQSTLATYYPAVDNWGVEVHSLEEAKIELVHLIRDKEQLEFLTRNVAKIRDDFFSF